MTGQPARRMGPRVLALAFAAVVVVLSASVGLAVGIAHNTQQRVDEITNKTLQGVELLGRMAIDVHVVQRLVAEHIFERAPDKMAKLERRIEAARADFGVAAAHYERLLSRPGDVDAWRQLRDDVRRSEAPAEQALALSRANRDPEAQAVMVGVESLFDTISRDVTSAIGLDERGAHDAVEEGRRLQREALVYQLAIWCVGVLLTAGVAVRVTRQFARAQERERQAFAVLEQRNQELDAFAGRVAHDFRAPLATVKLAASVLRLPTGDLPKSIDAIERGITRMSAMIDDMLQLSKIEEGARSDVCDPAVAAATVRENLAERIAAAGATMRVSVAPARVRCREGLFQQLVANLAENALKYHREGVAPEVIIDGAAAGARYELRVADNGIGLSTEEAARVFDPLFRAGRLREVPGTGLGLSIVKRIVEAYGGSASVESKLGQGSTFVIRLPLGEAA